MMGNTFSTEYINSMNPMLWKCHQGHIWSTPFNNIKNIGSWYNYCASNAQLDIEDAKKLALSRNGYSSYGQIKNQKSWCPTCNSSRKSIDDMHQHARSRKGDCLSDKYYNVFTKLKWICEKSHIWKACPEDVLRGTWCPVCASNISYTIENAKQIASDRNGECLSKEYINNSNWCPYCTGNTRLTLEDMRTLAQKKGGGGLSDKYYNVSTKLKWICKNDHIWEAVPARLELDISYYEYDFAIKVQGEQHEKFNKFFHRGNPNNFIKQQAWDQLKKELCEENQIVLRYVWYYEDPYIVISEHLRELGLIE
ncbi:hypothetical protein C1645_823713 [Glomus cerebriforme]|uniref:Zinc-ribbon domain-containing protein n=1 Tax=Glomus cerebriforme TaxID=658196 RepID=A0A397SVC2_9GLOM|nr:hypothetical protein C1645_823713 [Glomus cerebriforme]